MGRGMRDGNHTIAIHMEWRLETLSIQKAKVLGIGTLGRTGMGYFFCHTLQLGITSSLFSQDTHFFRLFGVAGHTVVQ